MADSPRSGESPADSLVKKEPDIPAEDPIVSRSTSGWMLVSALLMTLSIAWALYDEAFLQRPWKGMQREFVSRYTRYLDSIKANAGKSEGEIKESPDYVKLDDEAKAAREAVEPELKELEAKVTLVQKKLDAITDPFQNQRGRLTVINYNVETSEGRAKERYIEEAKEKRAEIVEIELPQDDGTTKEERFDYAQLEKLYDSLREEKAAHLGKQAELLKTPSELAKKRDEYLQDQLIGLGPTQLEGLKNKVASYDYSILGHQISVGAYGIVDRCEVCHAGIREPLNIKASDMAPDGPGTEPDSLARAFVSHPNREIFNVHKPDKFGCSSCHWGNGRATTNITKGHGRHRFWLWPMFEKENTEAGCQQCHARDRVTQGAEVLNLGRDLFSERGCVGCHRYEAFDRETDALAGTRQTIGQLRDSIRANEKEIREVIATSELETTPVEEVKPLLAKADSLRVTNSLLAARVDQLTLQERYLLQDQKKVGPNLKDVRVKLRKEWVPVWLDDPQKFRPGTKMPTFWRFSAPKENSADMRDKDHQEQIQAISAYLWQESFDSKLPAQNRGDAGKGKQLFETRGCLACHSIGEGDNKMGGDFAANLQRVGEKANFDYITRWIYNPRDRVAPYCPLEKRDLTPEDYSKKNLPFVFDTELHSKCPNDGAELQVQNMTVMPNFRLSESDARDIATYLFSLSSPPQYQAANFMDDASLKERGRTLIKQYGCAGCHEIRGFEEEQRIGKELTVEGATPIERLDFALQTHHAEKGEDPLNLRPEQKELHKPWYNHKGFFERKIEEPSIYDVGKEKDVKDKLKMPEPYMTPEWRRALTTFLLGSVGEEGSNVPRTLFYTPQDQRRQDVQNGWWVIKKYNCVGCHEIQVGQRSVVQDLAFYQTPEGKDLLPPRLTSEGARVDPTWLLKFLTDPSLSGEKTPGQQQQINALAAASPTPQAAPQASGSPQPSGSPQASGSPQVQAAAANGQIRLHPQPGLDRNGVRPYLSFRMPTFNFSPNELQMLVRFFMAMSGQQDPYIKEPMKPLTPQERTIARDMFTSGTPCLKCHITGDPGRDATAIAPNFLLAGERLKPDWTYRWLLDPAQISPGTAMPSGLFRREGEHWVVNLGQPLSSAANYHDDHARLLVRYMFLLTPDEQRSLLAAGPATTAAPTAATTQHHARAKKKRKVRSHHRRSRVSAAI
ncbi:MAG TPA: c-type cytochrome, partial [Pyrinomonadaceae bacterium]|nr:c-type cytochrome [Pyrinomonadaceae bacterium]